MRVSRQQAADRKIGEKMASNAIDFHETRSDTGAGISLEIQPADYFVEFISHSAVDVFIN